MEVAHNKARQLRYKMINLKTKYHLLYAFSAAYTDALLKFLNLFIRITLVMLTFMLWSNHTVPLHLLYCSYQYFSNAKMCIFLSIDTFTNLF